MENLDEFEHVILTEGIVHDLIDKPQMSLTKFLQKMNKVKINNSNVDAFARYYEKKEKRQIRILRDHGVSETDIKKIIKKIESKYSKKVLSKMGKSGKVGNDGISDASKEKIENLDVEMKDIIGDIVDEIKLMSTDYKMFSGPILSALVVFALNAVFVGIITTFLVVTIGVSVSIASTVGVIVIGLLVTPFTDEAYKSAVTNEGKVGAGYVIFNTLETIIISAISSLPVVLLAIVRVISLVLHATNVVIHKSANIKGSIDIDNKDQYQAESLKIAFIVRALYFHLVELKEKFVVTTFPHTMQMIRAYDMARGVEKVNEKMRKIVSARSLVRVK